MSETDIHIGDRWSERLVESLAGHDLGIICVTPENKNAPWLIYEAGALSKSIGTARVCPLLFQLRPEDLTGNPLSQFQAAPVSREGLLRLVTTLNADLKEEQISEAILKRSFDAQWSDFERALERLASLETQYEPAQLPAILDAFAKHNFPAPSISSAASFSQGFESHQLYEASTSIAKQRLYNFSRLNRKLIDKEHWGFFERISRQKDPPFDLKLLFLSPDAPEHIIQSAHSDPDFRQQLREAIENAVTLFERFGMDPNLHCRTYSTDRPVATTIVDDAVMFAPVRVDETGTAMPLTRSGFSIVHARSRLGTDLLNEFTVRWNTGSFLKSAF